MTPDSNDAHLANALQQASGGQYSGSAIVSPWLANLQFDWKDVTQGIRKRQIASEEMLFLEGQVADTVYVVEKGRIRLTAYSPDGKDRHLMIVGANGTLGDCGLISTKHYVLSAVAATDSVVSTVQTSTFLRALDGNPHLMRQHLAMSSMRLRIMMQHLAMQGPNSGQRRVCHYLLGLMNSYGRANPQGILIYITFTQQEMGNICGLSRVSVSQIFTSLERERIIARGGRLVLILSPEKLTHLSNA